MLRPMFDVIGRFRDWLRSVTPDPKQRTYTTHIMVAMALVALKQEGVPATRADLIRLTGMSSSSVYRSTGLLRDLGMLKRDKNGVWNWNIAVPKDISNAGMGIQQNNYAIDSSAVDELKAFITQMLDAMQAEIPNSKDRLEVVRHKVEEFSTKPKTGASALFGDAVLGEKDIEQ